MIPRTPLHAPARARHERASHNAAPGICLSVDQGHLGWFVPVRERSGGRRHVLIRLLVGDPRSSFRGFVRFLIDTGAEQTIIPRSELRGPEAAAAFAPRRDVKSIPMWMPNTGRPVLADRFGASLHLTPAGGGSSDQNFSFGEVSVAVTHQWPSDWPGLLGLDVLRQLILVADAEHFTLWRHVGAEKKP